MAIKTITYQRVLNLGNYESKRLELSAEVLEGDDPDEKISRLMEKVERKIREDAAIEINKEMSILESNRTRLISEVYALNVELKKLGKIKDESGESDNVPFESGEPLKNGSPEDMNKYF